MLSRRNKCILDNGRKGLPVRAKRLCLQGRDTAACRHGSHVKQYPVRTVWLGVEPYCMIKAGCNEIQPQCLCRSRQVMYGQGKPEIGNQCEETEVIDWSQRFCARHLNPELPMAVLPPITKDFPDVEKGVAPARFCGASFLH